MLWLIVPVLRWRTTTYELTTRRLRTRYGLVTRRGRDIPLARINDVSFEKGLLDRLLGAGRLVVESAGEHGQIVLRDIPQVEQVQATLYRLVEDGAATARPRPAKSAVIGADPGVSEVTRRIPS